MIFENLLFGYSNSYWNASSSWVAIAATSVEQLISVALAFASTPAAAASSEKQAQSVSLAVVEASS